MSKAQYIVFTTGTEGTRFCTTESGLSNWSPEFPDAHLFDTRTAAKNVAKTNKAKVAIAETCGTTDEQIIANYEGEALSPFGLIETTLATKWGPEVRLLAASLIDTNCYLVAVYFGYESGVKRHKGVTWLFNVTSADFACGNYHSGSTEEELIVETLGEYSTRLADKIEFYTSRMVKLVS